MIDRLIGYRIKRSIGFVADMHIGSPWGMWPEGFTTEQGNVINPSPGQRTINGYFEEFCHECDHYEVDTIISMAEIIDGTNYFEQGASRLTADKDIQAEAAKLVLKPLVKEREFYGFLGSPYHDSKNGKIEKHVIECEELGGKCLGVLANTKLRDTNRILNLAHGVGGSLIYRATKSDRELLFVLAAEAAKKIDFHVDLFVRAHLHFFGFLDQGINSYLQLPGWSDWIPYKFSLTVYGRQPDIGWVILLVDTDDNFHIIKKLYPLPQISGSLRTL